MARDEQPWAAREHSAWTQWYIQTLRRNQQLGSQLLLPPRNSSPRTGLQEGPFPAQPKLSGHVMAKFLHGEFVLRSALVLLFGFEENWHPWKVQHPQVSGAHLPSCFLPSMGRRSQLPKAKAQLATSFLFHTSSRQEGRKENGQTVFFLWKAKTIIEFCKQGMRVIKNWRYIVLTCAFFLA